MVEAGTSSSISISRFSTEPSSVTMTTSMRPRPSFTNSMWRRGKSSVGATTRPAQRDSPESVEMASVKSSSTLPPALQWASMLARSSSSRCPTSNSPSTKNRSPASVGMRPAERWVAYKSPAISKSDMTLRIEAGESPMSSCRASVREPIGSPDST